MRRSKSLSAKLLQIVLVLSALTAFSGCAIPRLTKEARAGINSVTISSQVRMPSKMDYGSSERMSGTAFGLVGALITWELGKDEEEKLNAMMRENNIDIGRMVVQQFREQLAAKQVFQSIVTSGGDANFGFKIHFYDLSWVPSAGNCLAARLKATVYLKKANGDLVWKATAYYAGGKTDAYLYETYIADPKLLRTVLEQAARAVVGDLVDSIESD